MLTLRLLGKNFSRDLFGLSSTALLVLGCLPVLDGGFRTSINRHLLQAKNDAERRGLMVFGQRLYSWFGLFALLVGVAALFLYSFTPNARSLGLPLAFYVTLGSTGSLVVLANAHSQQLIGWGLQRRVFAIQAGQAWLTLALLWVALRNGLGVWSLVISTGGSQIAVVLVTTVLVRAVSPDSRPFELKWGDAERTRLKTLWPESSGVMQMQIWTLLLYAADAILVGCVWSGAQVGHYALAATIFSKIRALLQSADEAVWPILAAKGDKAEQISDGLRRFNGWLYGSAMMTSIVCLPAFVSSYLGGEWEVGSLLFVPFAVRALITGIATQPSWWLYGHGWMRSIAGHVRRELLTALLLSIPLGVRFGPEGVAWAFLAATVSGALLPLPAEYARRAGLSVANVLAGSWLRALFAGSVSALIAWVCLLATDLWQGVMAGACVAASVPLALVAINSIRRSRRAGKLSLVGISRYL